MNFSEALNALKAGGRVTRAGWNGKGMFVVLQAGYPDGIPINRNTAQATGIPEGTVRQFRPYLMLCDDAGAFVPWLPSQADLLKDDWQEHLLTQPAAAYGRLEPLVVNVNVNGWPAGVPLPEVRLTGGGPRLARSDDLIEVNHGGREDT